MLMLGYAVKAILLCPPCLPVDRFEVQASLFRIALSAASAEKGLRAQRKACTGLLSVCSHLLSLYRVGVLRPLRVRPLLLILRNAL